jgi:predicted phosphodiesterase
MTKRLAILSDVHADASALRDALVQIQKLGCDEIVCAGDLLDWGTHPEETISLLKERGIPCVRGNHDRWAIEHGEDIRGRPLTGRTVCFLESLVRLWQTTIEGVRVVIWHARPGSDMEGICPDENATDLELMLTKAEAGLDRWPHARPDAADPSERSDGGQSRSTSARDGTWACEAGHGVRPNGRDLSRTASSRV